MSDTTLGKLRVCTDVCIDTAWTHGNDFPWVKWLLVCFLLIKWTLIISYMNPKILIMSTKNIKLKIEKWVKCLFLCHTFRIEFTPSTKLNVPNSDFILWSLPGISWHGRILKNVCPKWPKSCSCMDFFPSLLLCLKFPSLF